MKFVVYRESPYKMLELMLLLVLRHVNQVKIYEWQ